MDAASLQDLIDRGSGIAARAVGVPCDAYRPTTPFAPLSAANRFLRIDAAFSAEPAFKRGVPPSAPIWQVLLDGAYMQAGDYLVEAVPGGRTWFIGAAQSLLPRLCVLTNTSISITRPGSGAQPGAIGYGGTTAAITLSAGFPVSLLHGGSTHGEATMPADTRQSAASALLPAVPGVVFTRGDMLRDAAGRAYLVNMAEYSSLGCRLDLRQAAS